LYVHLIAFWFGLLGEFEQFGGEAFISGDLDGPEDSLLESGVVLFDTAGASTLRHDCESLGQRVLGELRVEALVVVDCRKENNFDISTGSHLRLFYHR
jgi:hypothetical protein